MSTGLLPAAYSLYLMGLLTAFAVRTWVQVRRTGSTGFNGISGPPGSLPWSAGILFVLAAGITAPALVLTGVSSVPVGSLARAAAVTGVAVLLAGVLGTVGAQSGMGASWRIGVDQDESTDLVTTGVFAIVRNPIFTAMVTAQAGMTLVAPTPLAVSALVCLVLAVQLQARVIEEPYLHRVHRGAYSAYASRVGRFLPGIGRGIGGRSRRRPATGSSAAER